MVMLKTMDAADLVLLLGLGIPLYLVHVSVDGSRWYKDAS